jgi:hypothetical protein
MSNPIATSVLIALCLLTLLSCQQADTPKGTPACINNTILDIQNEAVRNPPAKVWSYEYNGETVYYVSAFCCDIPSTLYDKNCNVICHPDGGFSGGGDGLCSDFFTTRSNEKLIWEDGR